MTARTATTPTPDRAGGQSPDSFDFAGAVFVAQDQRPARLQPVDMAALTPFQRGLLVTDGTVTRFVEAYWLEPVTVTRLGQRQINLAADDPWMGLAAGSPVIHRRVILQGSRTGRFFTWADSVMAVDRLPARLAQGLERDGGGLGRILIDAALETRRECLWFGRERPEAVPPEVSAQWPGDFLTRAYRVLAGGRPIMLITERFAL